MLPPQTIIHSNSSMSQPEFALAKLEFDRVRDALAGYLSTPSGREMAAHLGPSGNPEEVAWRLEASSEMMQLLNASETPPLQTLYDVQDAVARAKIQRFVLDGTHMAKIGRWLESARLLRSFFSQQQQDATQMWTIASRLVPAKDLEQQIQRVVDEKGEIMPNASPELTRIDRRMANLKQSARTVLQRILRQGMESGMTSDEEATLRGGRLVIPVKSEFKRKVKGFIHDTSATGQTVYIEPVEVFEKNNEIRELESERRREVERLLRELTARVGEKSDLLIQNTGHIGRIDLIYASTRLGMRWNGVIPDISDDGSLLLMDCRNPLLLMKYQNIKDGKDQVVPMNLDMGPGDMGIIITGPNAGGKSVTLKTIGLAMVLAQCGIPLPAMEGARLPCISGLWVDMGDEQSIDNDLSTFSSRLNWMKQVMDSAKPGSWVLMDEAGSGTDPDEGTALVQAFLELLSDKGIRCIVTTHHGALKVFAHETTGWYNASMEFDQQSLSPTYRFRKGIPGSSYAFEIAERLDIPHSLTRRARDRVGSGKNRMESLIISLERESQRIQEQQAELQIRKRDMDAAKLELEKRLARIREERDSIRERAIDEAGELLHNANKKIEEAIRAATEKNKDQLKDKRGEIEALDSEVRAAQHRKRRKKKNTGQGGRTPAKGDPVRLVDSNMTGELLELNGKQATVEVNGLRIKTRLDNLVLSDRKPGRSRSAGYRFAAGGGSTGGHARPFSASLDIRGMRGDDAVRQVMRYIDDGLMRGMQQVMIIHGKGDGILRKLVHEHLEKRKDVRKFEPAPIQEGGNGCTCVYL